MPWMQNASNRLNAFSLLFIIVFISLSSDMNILPYKFLSSYGIMGRIYSSATFQSQQNVCVVHSTHFSHQDKD